MEVVMRIGLIVLIVILFLFIGCGPITTIQKTYLRVDQTKTGEVDIFSSLDEIERPFKKVAELKVTDQRPPHIRDRNQMIESLKAKAHKLGADGIVIIEERDSVTRIPAPAGGGWTNHYSMFIKGLAIVY
jgi:hypothetical protein